MTEMANISVRMDRETAARTRVRAEARGERLSDAVRRYAEEGDRAETYRGSSFARGRRVAAQPLRAAPTSEICLAARQVGGETQLGEELSLIPDQVALTLRYALLILSHARRCSKGGA